MNITKHADIRNQAHADELAIEVAPICAAIAARRRTRLRELRDASLSGSDMFWVGDDPIIIAINKDDSLACKIVWHIERAECRFRKAIEAAAKSAKKAAQAKRKARKTAARESDTKTCQICGRGIKALAGAIAHHGYQRPGIGWQTASCFGAQCAPFEVSRVTLKTWINRLDSRSALDTLALEEFIATPPHSIETKDPRTGAVTSINRPSDFDAASRPATLYARLYANRLYLLKRDLGHLIDEIASQQNRYDNWAPAKPPVGPCRHCKGKGHIPAADGSDKRYCGSCVNTAHAAEAAGNAAADDDIKDGTRVDWTRLLATERPEFVNAYNARFSEVSKCAN